MLRIYVAGPYHEGDPAVNVKKAIDAGENLMRMGFAPFVPHLAHFWQMIHPHTREEWTAQDESWLRCCYALYRMPGASAQADLAVEAARKAGNAVYTDIGQLYEDLGGRAEPPVKEVAANV